MLTQPEPRGGSPLPQPHGSSPCPSLLPGPPPCPSGHLLLLLALQHRRGMLGETRSLPTFHPLGVLGLALGGQLLAGEVGTPPGAPPGAPLPSRST